MPYFVDLVNLELFSLELFSFPKGGEEKEE
jgi:hypothetical protein